MKPRTSPAPSGIVSPWTAPPKVETPLEQQLHEKARRGEALIRMVGLRYELHVRLPVTYRAAEDAEKAAALVIGRFFDRNRAALKSLLATQKIFYDVQQLLEPKVTLEFGETPLYAAASSHNVELAEKYALDRLASVLTVANLTASMMQHFMSVVRVR
jgi:hypothetical protein